MMAEIPDFTLYGENDPQIEEAIQPGLDLRKWSDLGYEEKKIALQYLIKKGWLRNRSPEILSTIDYLNHKYLRQCPGKNLHNTPPSHGVGHMQQAA